MAVEAGNLKTHQLAAVGGRPKSGLRAVMAEEGCSRFAFLLREIDNKGPQSGVAAVAL